MITHEQLINSLKELGLKDTEVKVKSLVKLNTGYHFIIHINYTLDELIYIQTFCDEEGFVTYKKPDYVLQISGVLKNEDII